MQARLRQLLPDYMVPSYIAALDELPLNSNGKVDRKQLPTINLKEQAQVYVAPRNQAEQTLCKMWQELLEVEQVGINDNFFALGGHSLLAVQLLSNVNEHFKIDLSLQTLFGLSTLEELAQVIEKQQPKMDEVSFARMDDLLAELELSDSE